MGRRGARRGGHMDIFCLQGEGDGTFREACRQGSCGRRSWGPLKSRKKVEAEPQKAGEKVVFGKNTGEPESHPGPVRCRNDREKKKGKMKGKKT